MADDVLSAAELEMLLAARASTAVPAGCSSPRPLPTPGKPPSERRPSPPPLGENLKRAVSALGKDWGRKSATELSALVRRPVRVELAAVTQVTYREFAARLANPTCFNVLSAAPLEGHWMLEISPAILYPAIDCMLGGGRELAPIAARPLTDIELRLAGRVTSLLVRQLQAAWRPIVELELSLQRVASGPQASATAKSSDAIVWLRFKIALQGARGALNLGIPTQSLAGIAGKLAGEPGGNAKSSGPADQADAANSHPAGATVELVACLARSTIARGDVRDLSVGDVITTEQQADAPIAVLQDGVLRFRARAGSLKGHKALEIEDVAAESKNAAPGES
jgi:flagellar motor switch protein FliM